MKRRDFLRGVAYASALAAGEMIPSVIPKALAASTQEPEPPVYSQAEKGALDRATFDFYVEHKTLLVASTINEADREAEFEILVNSITPVSGEIALEIVPVDAPAGFFCTVEPSTVTPNASGRQIRCRARVPLGVEEGREVLFKVIGTRGGEKQELPLRVKVLTAAPRWELGLSETKVREQPLKITSGRPVRFRLSLANQGHLGDIFAIEAKAPEGWTARLTDEYGRPMENLWVGPVQGIFQWEDPREVWLEVTPLASAQAKKRVAVTVTARSMTTGKKDRLALTVFPTPMLFSVNDLDGLDPRVHYLQAGSITSYVLHLLNPIDVPLQFRLKCEGLPNGWSAKMPKVPIEVTPDEDREVLVTVRSPASAKKGERATLNVCALDPKGNAFTSVRLGAEVYDIPKLYILVIDSLDYEYLNLNKNGDGPGNEGDWLCPNIRNFKRDGTSFSQARCGMPAATDMNHTTIVSGAQTGVLGTYWVSGLYAGLDPLGDIVVVRPNPDILRHGLEGKRLERIFDMVKTRYPSARSVVVSNKAWVSALHEDGEAVRWGITGSHFPVYADAPPRFVLGDPQSADNHHDRRRVKPPELMVNLNPLDLMPQVLHGDFELLKPALYDVGKYIGSKPGFFPDDQWVAKTTCQVIREEDPEVIYVNLAAVDEAGHVFGAAWDPKEWSKAGGFFGSYSVSKYSEQARREEILNVVREADRRFGEIINELKSRGTFDNSIIVFAADHSMITEGYRKQKYAALDIKEYLRSQGIISPKHYGTAWSLNHYAAIFDVRDKATLQEIKRQLQGMTVDDPEKGEKFHPCIVLDREGMRTGIDKDNPFLAEPDRKIGEPLELYSTYYIEKVGKAEGKVRWPELFVFFRGHYQGTVPGDAVAKGVNGVGERMPVFRKSGSRWVGIHGSEGTTHVPMIFHTPSVKVAKEVNEPATLHDIVPSLCALLGWKAPETAAGKPRV